MNCYNQQFPGMPGTSVPERPMMPSWQNQPRPAETEMFGWQRPMQKRPMSFSEKMDCGCFPLAMSYVPMQKWSQPSPLCEGFTRGTMFKELDLPFVMGRCR